MSEGVTLYIPHLIYANFNVPVDAVLAVEWVGDAGKCLSGESRDLIISKGKGKVAHSQQRPLTAL